MKKIQWTNKYSGETGYVGSILKSRGHFVNAPTIRDAHGYRTEQTAAAALSVLAEIGETENNVFQVVEA
jgi:hypothetical protein